MEKWHRHEAVIVRRRLMPLAVAAASRPTFPHHRTRLWPVSARRDTIVNLDENTRFVYSIPYILNGSHAMRFSWDPAKEARNKAKHGFDFSFAEFVFADPLHAVVLDRYEDAEDR
jgi:hypothetical protein